MGVINKMDCDTSKIQDFCRIFGIPDPMKPWLNRFFKKTEIDLVLMLAGLPMGVEEIADKFEGIAGMEGPENLSFFLERCYKRGIINRRSDGCYEPADFHTRLDVWAMFEGWKDVPGRIREQLNAAELEYSERHYQDSVHRMQKGLPRDPSDIYAEYILLQEGEALLDRVNHIYLLPCNCRLMKQGCSQSVYTCLRFENHRNLGWEISTSRAKEIMQAANRKGLMQTAEVALTQEGVIRGAICNCCADCCVHPELTERYDARNVWPLSRYVARHLTDRCTACGLCVKRCPFDAFTAENIKPDMKDNPHLKVNDRKKIHLNEKACRGCGVCSTGCPDKAIRMIPLETCTAVYSLITRIGCGPVPESGQNDS
jgi:Pyruvate/2-oxoacid:ferredoxin oxidoreductase delta subunit